MEEIKKNILLLLAVVIISFVILEGGLRLFSYPVYGFEKGFYQYDDVRGYKLSSNFEGTHSIYNKVAEVRTNSKGLRDYREYEYEKGNSTRIVLLGDSKTFGNGVNLEESYPGYLRELYKNEDVEVINLGVPGYGFNNEFLSFIEEGSKYNPDIILITYAINDWNKHQIINDNGRYTINKSHTFFVNDKGIMASRTKEIGLYPTHLFFLLNFRSYSFIYSKSRLILDNVVDKFFVNHNLPAYYLDKNSIEYNQAYEGYSSLLKTLQENTNATIVIFISPLEENILDKEEIKDIFNIDYDLDTLQTQNSIKEIAKELNIQVIEKEVEEDIFLEVDGHWNSKGNRIMANKIYDGLNVGVEDGT